ncbi:hypothetical protein E4U46_001882 [Claviceps purpurea]|nr:hypothetical protein E4U27_007748 [Claviceps purpurea]KAG6254821.1 hypothetical protein E4U23_005513 [Claviceps purpurea]KAG6271080.1 hypothetical protein E4U49_004630 [Claviceps purpurea]KAG6296591.1 hypothetical protein E4U46_001882 [Claviceps purpurea]
MALDDKDAQRAPGGGEKTLQVWSEPIGVSTDEGQPTATKPVAVPSLSEVVGSLKKDDFTDLYKTPCARQGTLTGIAVGAGAGGLRFVLKADAVKAANMAVGVFVLGSVLSYEYCQYLRRVERKNVQRTIEIVNGRSRELAKKAAEEKEAQSRLEMEKVAAQKPWYKIW